jgi:hypothetical protein
MSQDWTPPPPAGASANVPNYLIPAIISLFCCLPLGIVGVIFAAQVNGKVQAGDTRAHWMPRRKRKCLASSLSVSVLPA